MFDDNSIEIKTEKDFDNLYECYFVWDNLSEYIENELSDEDAEKITNHLKKCKYCRDDYKNMLDFKSTVKKYFDNTTNPINKHHLSQETLAKIRSHYKMKNLIFFTLFLINLTIGLSLAYLYFTQTN